MSAASRSELPQGRSELPQGTLDLLALKAVGLGPLHGYAIARRIQQMSQDRLQVPHGSLYPALHRLENRGYLAAEWRRSATGRRSKFYRLTRRGRAHLERQTRSWNRLTEAVALVLAAGKTQPSWGGREG